MGVLVLLELSKTEVLDWRKNFDIEKKSPFGLFIFNEEVDHLLNNKVKRTAVSPYDYYSSQTDKTQNILLIQAETDIESWKKILLQVEKGSDVLALSDKFHPDLGDSLGFSVGTTSLRFDNVLKLNEEKFENDSFDLDKMATGQGFKSFKKEHQILGTAEFDGGKVNFLKINHGKGHLYLHTEPLIVTNYYLLKPGNEKFVADVFSYLPNRETIWFTGGKKSVAESQSPLRFILSKPALRYAWWLLLGGLLLFVIFNAKRKQRIVPIVEPLKNRSVEFVKSIGNLYMQEGDFHDMMAKKAQYFLNRVRMDYLLDTQNLDEKFVHSLHLKSGKSVEKINEAIALLKKGQDPYASVMKEDLVKMNKLLDEILR